MSGGFEKIPGGKNMELSRNIIRFRKERGLTQEQLANLLNVSVSAVSKWELGNNRPDLELLPNLAEIFQISIDSLLGYEKSYKSIDKTIDKLNILLAEEKYRMAIEEALSVLQRYPNDARINEILANAYYSLCFSVNEQNEKRENAKKAVYYIERCIELSDEVQISECTKETLYCNIATLYGLEEIGKYEEAVCILEKYNGNGKYDNMIAGYLFADGKRREAKNRLLQHCIGQQVFVFNDLSILADMFVKEGDVETAILFLEKKIQLYELFMEEAGGYADRAYAGQAYIISGLYKKINRSKEAAKWYEKAKKHAEIYMRNPSMLISSMRYCKELEGRMIDNYGEILDRLASQTEDENQHKKSGKNTL